MLTTICGPARRHPSGARWNCRFAVVTGEPKFQSRMPQKETGRGPGLDYLRVSTLEEKEFRRELRAG